MSKERKKLVLALAIIFAVNIFIIALAQNAAVGAVVLNRIEHPSFPNSLSGVIYHPEAFTCMVDGQFEQPVAESSYRAAQDALNGYDPSNGATYYFNPVTATSKWIWSRPLIETIGKHMFCA